MTEDKITAEDAPKIVTREQKAQYAEQVGEEYQWDLEEGHDLG